MEMCNVVHYAVYLQFMHKEDAAIVFIKRVHRVTALDIRIQSE